MDREIGAAYGTRRPDDHAKAGSPRRFTYLIDPEGKVAKAYVVRDIAAHREEVLQDLLALQT